MAWNIYHLLPVNCASSCKSSGTWRFLVCLLWTWGWQGTHLPSRRTLSCLGKSAAFFSIEQSWEVLISAFHPSLRLRHSGAISGQEFWSHISCAESVLTGYAGWAADYCLGHRQCRDSTCLVPGTSWDSIQGGAILALPISSILLCF